MMNFCARHQSPECGTPADGETTPHQIGCAGLMCVIFFGGGGFFRFAFFFPKKGGGGGLITQKIRPVVGGRSDPQGVRPRGSGFSLS